MSAAVERIVSDVLNAGAMVGGPSMRPITPSTPTPPVQRLVPAAPPKPAQPARADAHPGTLLLGVGIGVVLTFAVFTFGRSS